MEVSVSGYYAWQKRPSSERSRLNQQLVAQIKTVHADSDQTYGSPRVHAQLRAQGQRCSQNRVARLMHRNGITACWKRRFVPTTESKHNLPVAPNGLNREFTAQQADQKWVADIIYIWTQQGWVYWAVVLTCSPGGLVLAALLARQPEQGLLHHSDRGSQYAIYDYQQLLEKEKFSCSMSRKGNCSR